MYYNYVIIHESNDCDAKKRGKCMSNEPNIDKYELSLYHDLTPCYDIYEAEKSLLAIRSSELVEICTVLSGSGVHLIFNQPIPCAEGDVFIIPPGVPHRYFLESGDGKLILRRIRFNAKECFADVASDMSSPQYCYGVFRENAACAYAALNSNMRGKVAALCDAIEKEAEERKYNWRSASISYLVQLLIQIERYINSSIKNITEIPHKNWSMAMTAIRMIEDGYKSPDFTLESIAKKLLVSKTNLSGVFARFVGKSFSKYLKEVRMNRAKVLLSTTKMTVEDIVYSVGLRDLSTFYKNFEDFAGMTPKEYRRLAKPSNTTKNNNNNYSSSVLDGVRWLSR